MINNRGYNTYINNHYDGMTPEKLILMLYDGALKKISLAKEGIIENDIPKRGENISKAIAIVTELYASLDPDMKDESTEFLRGLYYSIILELPKVSLTNNIKTLEITESYLKRLKDIWENDVMVKKPKHSDTSIQKIPISRKPSYERGYGDYGNIQHKSISV